MPATPATRRCGIPAVVLHLIGGLKHLLMDRADVFNRMWPVRR